MWPALHASTNVVASSALVCAGAVGYRVFVPASLRSRKGWLFIAIFAVVEVIAHIAWLRFPFSNAALGATVASILLCLAAFLVASLPAAALVHRIAVWGARKARPAAVRDAPLCPSRRAFVSASFCAVPTVALGAGIRGFTTANKAPEVPRLRMAFPELHPDLDGLSILHLTDLHLGVERHASDVEALVAHFQNQGTRPNLVVLTGDIAEDPRELARATRALEALRPKHGLYACLGNHEYLNGIRAHLAAFREARLPLLVDQGTAIRIGAAELFLGGVDDPRRLDAEVARALVPSVSRALRGARKDAFRLLLSHRPDGIVAAAEAGADLVLSGHTHGGQIGWGGRSAFEPVFEDRYLWGSYVRNKTALYTSSGFGHWFPFRIMCPTEAPLITLARSAEQLELSVRGPSVRRSFSSG